MPRASPSASISASRSTVGPAPRRRGQPRLELLAVEGRHLARRRANDEVDARERRVAEQHVEVGAVPANASIRMRWNFIAQVGRIGLARHVHQARDEAVERVAPHEQRSRCRSPSARMPSAVSYSSSSEIWNSSSRGKVSRMWSSALARWPPGGRPARSAIASTLPPQQRRLRHARAVGAGREQAEEPVLADHAGPRRRSA
jgi:hypothetical protein